MHYTSRRTDIVSVEALNNLSEDPVFQTRLSVIIPTLSPVEDLAQELLLPIERMLRPEDEIIVVRGITGREPKMSELGNRIRCMTSPPGRGRQLNAGAEIAVGDILFFLHDDCMPPTNFAHAVRGIALAPNMSLGCFRLAFSPSSRSMDMIAAWANLRARCFRLPYGDQGLFCRREVFDRIGGFKRLFLMEDVDLVERAGQCGDLLMCPEKILASPRRYLSRGILRASMLNHLIMLLYRLGVPDRKLYSLYYGT